MNISENLIRIKQGKDDIIKSLKNKGVSINDNTLINEIPTIIDNAEIGGGGDTPSVPTELVPKYDGASVFRINVPEDNYEFTINLCNDATKATYDVDWGDGSLEYGLKTNEQHHTYSKSGTYDVNIYNISKDITFGGSYTVSFGGGSNTVYVSYLFNNTNNDYWVGINYLYQKDNITITNVLIGKSIKEIGAYAFSSCSSLQSVVIPDSVTSIGNYAFRECSSLQSVVISDSVTSIGKNTFHRCYSLQSVVIPDSVTKIENDAFRECSSLQSVVISNSVTSIGNYAFSSCSSLTSVVIPDSVTSIGNYAFSSCFSLQSVVISNSVTSIGSSAFSSCSSLTSLNIPNTVTSIGSSAFSSCSSLQSVVIPDSVTSIGSSAFSYCSSLQSVVISNSVTSIGSSAFEKCNSLQSITCNALTAPTTQSNTFPTSSFRYSKRYLYVSKESTGYDGNWKTYLIDKGWELRYIEDYEKTPTTLKLKTVNNFFHNLQTIGQANLINYELINDEYIYHFDDKITELVQNTFYNKVLEEIELPEGVEYLGENLFETSLISKILLPNSLTYIEGYVFASCRSLESITITENVTSIGKYTFYECTSLKSITCKAMTAPTIQTDSFINIGTNVPSGTPKVLRVSEGASGYDSGNWKTYVLNKGYTLEYITE